MQAADGRGLISGMRDGEGWWWWWWEVPLRGSQLAWSWLDIGWNRQGWEVCASEPASGYSKFLWQCLEQSMYVCMYVCARRDAPGSLLYRS